MPPLHEADLTESTLADDLQGLVVLHLLARAQEAKEVCLRLPARVLLALLSCLGDIAAQCGIKLLRSVDMLSAVGQSCVFANYQLTSHCEHERAQHSPGRTPE